jgi:hypothetical protein
MYDKGKRQKANMVAPINLAGDISAESCHARKAWSNIFQVLKKNSCQSQMLYSAKLSLNWVPVAHTCHPSYLEAEIWRITAQGLSRQIVCELPSPK